MAAGENHFSLKTWPLIDYSCSRGWPHAPVHMGSTIGLNRLWKKKTIKEDMKLGGDCVGGRRGDRYDQNTLYTGMRFSSNK